MALHRRYDMVRLLLDGKFHGYRRQARQKGLELESDELWHDLMEVALEADREWQGDTGEGWKSFVLDRVEARLGSL